MRRISKKRAAQNRKIAPERRAYVMARTCVLSGLQATDCHEICGGSDKQRTDKEKRFWLAVNRLHHDELQYTPKVKQWAIKLLKDPANFEASALVEIPGKKVDPLEVLDEVARMLVADMQRFAPFPD